MGFPLRGTMGFCNGLPLKGAMGLYNRVRFQGSLGFRFYKGSEVVWGVLGFRFNNRVLAEGVTFWGEGLLQVLGQDSTS